MSALRAIVGARRMRVESITVPAHVIVERSRLAPARRWQLRNLPNGGRGKLRSADTGSVTFGSLTQAGDELVPDRRGKKLVAGTCFALLTIGLTVLLGGRLAHTSWPLERARMSLVGLATALYFASFVLRALGWQKLFPAEHRPGRSRCLAACGAAAASGAVLPFRLDYMVKIATLRRLPGVKLGLEAIALSIISLGLIDAVAFLPLSISATAATSSGFRLPMMLVVLFGL